MDYIEAIEIICKECGNIVDGMYDSDTGVFYCPVCGQSFSEPENYKEDML